MNLFNFRHLVPSATRHLLLGFALLVSVSAISAAPQKGAWAGVLGASSVPALPHELPVETWDLVCGSLSLTISPPSAKAPQGGYSAKLAVWKDSVALQFKGKGILGQNESGQTILSGNWRGSGAEVPVCHIELVFSEDDGARVDGYAEVENPSGSVYRFAAFALPLPYNRSSPAPSSIAGKLTMMFSTQDYSPIGILGGSIDTAGKMVIKGSWQDGRKATMVTSILLWHGTHFTFPASSLGSDLYVGGIARLSTQNDAGWVGTGWEIKKNSQLRVLDIQAFRTANSAVLKWPTDKADLYIEHGLDIEYAGGEVSVSPGSNKLITQITHPGIRSLSLSYSPTDGLVKGQLTYVVWSSQPERQETVQIIGNLNPATGEVRGRIGSIGLFSLMPKLAP